MSSSKNPRRVLEPGETVGVGEGSKTFVQAYAGWVACMKIRPATTAMTATTAPPTRRLR
jgi:hypothetical protein